MSETIKSESISRRKAILLLGLGAAFTLADSPEEPALAQQAAPATGGTKGIKRRKARRAARHQKRAKRREKAPAETAAPQ